MRVALCSALILLISPSCLPFSFMGSSSQRPVSYLHRSLTAVYSKKGGNNGGSEDEKKTGDSSPSATGSKTTGILDSPTFLKRKIEVLKSDLTKLTETDIPALEESVSAQKEEWGEQITRIRRETAVARDRLFNETKTLETTSKVEVVRALLPVIDNFERAFSSVVVEDGSKGEDVVGDFKAVFEEITEKLTGLGCEEIKCLGEVRKISTRQCVLTCVCLFF